LRVKELVTPHRGALVRAAARKPLPRREYALIML
jgi:hypothetical protein